MFTKRNVKCTYEIIRKNMGEIKQPVILFTSGVLNKFKAYCDIADGEIGWLCFVDKKDDTYTVYDTVLPKQEVSATTTDLSEESLNEIAFELMQSRPDDFDKVKAWAHSHVNMDTFASGTDDETFEQFYKDCDYFIRIICNKKGSMKVDFVDTVKEIRYDNVDWDIIYSEGTLQKLQDELSYCTKRIDELNNLIKSSTEDEYKKVKASVESDVKEKTKKKYTVIKNNFKSYGNSYGNSYGWNYEDYYYNNYGQNDNYYNNKKEDKKKQAVEEYYKMENSLYGSTADFWNSLSKVYKMECLALSDIVVVVGKDNDSEAIDLSEVLTEDELIRVYDSCMSENQSVFEAELLDIGLLLDDAEIFELQDDIYTNVMNYQDELVSYYAKGGK